MMSMIVSFLLSFFPRDVLDEILDLIESSSEGFSTYSLLFFSSCSWCFWNEDVGLGIPHFP